MKVWTATYYVANRYGSMVEKIRHFPANLTQAEAAAALERFLDTLKAGGTAVYPQFDLQLEIAA